jgi:hypothetical protein
MSQVPSGESNMLPPSSISSKKRYKKLGTEMPLPVQNTSNSDQNILPIQWLKKKFQRNIFYFIFYSFFQAFKITFNPEHLKGPNNERSSWIFGVHWSNECSQDRYFECFLLKESQPIIFT